MSDDGSLNCSTISWLCHQQSETKMVHPLVHSKIDKLISLFSAEITIRRLFKKHNSPFLKMHTVILLFIGYSNIFGGITQLLNYIGDS